MRKRLLILLLLTVTVTCAAVAAKARFTLVIDAGHGGNDAGALGRVTKEKAINLKVALAFGSLVERNCPDVKVIYTRKTDVFVPLHTRADIANRNKADLFVSIHTNSLPKGHVARGLETYTLGMHRAADNLDVAMRENAVIEYESDYKQRYQGFDPKSSESYIMFELMTDKNMAQSVEMAKYVQKRTCATAGRQNKGVKQAGFLVLRETSMPSCLIELGFISTPDEEDFLRTDAGVGRLALGIYQAFVDYKQKHAYSPVPVNYQPTQEETIPQVSQPASEDSRPPMDNQRVAEQQTETKQQTVAVPQTVTEQQRAEVSLQQTTATPDRPAKPVEGKPVFKVQILSGTKKLKTTDAQLKGLKDIDYYQEGGLYKYTVGASENYSEIYQLRKTLLAQFPQAFIIAFKNGQRTDVQAAIQEYRNNKRKGSK